MQAEPTPPWAVHLPPGTSAEHLDLLRERSLPASWSARWEQAPGAPVLHDPVHGWLTAQELEDLSRRVATRLLGAGLAAADRVLVSAQPSRELVVAHVAALRAGLVVVPVNPAYGQRELGHVVRDCAPAAAVVDDQERAGWVRRSAPGAVLVTGPDVALPEAPGVALPPPPEPDDPALLVYTSGTTGTPKGALLSHGNLLASAEAVRLAWRWAPDDRLLLALPLFHVHGLGVGLHGTLHAGASAVLRPRFAVDDVLDRVREHRASLLFGVPTMYARLAASSRLPELAALRLAVSGSAPLAPELFEAVAARGGQRVLERYGMSETLMNVSNPYDGERRPGTVGLPLPGVDVRLAEDTGEVLLRGPNVLRQYWARPDATAAALEGGWFRSGDVGAYDDAGYLRLVGRRSELIISGGFNVYPREVEDVLRAHPGVRDAAVVGRPDPEWGERVTAYVEADGVTPEQLAAHAAAQLATYKRPRDVRLVDALPRNALGKVVTSDLPA